MISLHPVEWKKLLDMVGFMMPKSKLSSTAKYKVSCQDVQFHPVGDRPVMSFLKKIKLDWPVEEFSAAAKTAEDLVGLFIDGISMFFDCRFGNPGAGICPHPS